MTDRRLFLQSLLAATAVPAASASLADTHDAGFGPLRPDPERILDLPDGFRYDVVAARGQEMDDGLLVPGLADGMAAFPGDDGGVILVCNHEIHPGELAESPFGRDGARFTEAVRSMAYDPGHGRTPGLGGTTTIHYDPAGRRRTHMHMSLIGTENNCAGGPTPWGSWLTCEECFFDPGTSFEQGRVVQRERRHGYLFEVPSRAEGPVEPVPLEAMGRFEHEAAAVDPSTGIVYLTEDRYECLVYRFIPEVPGQLARGGRLQALAVLEQPGFDTRNWVNRDGMRPGAWFRTNWIDLPHADTADNDLRFRGIERGAAIFARGEGITWADGELAFCATIGGPERLGQVFSYRPSPAEGTEDEAREPGRLRLFAQSDARSILRNADNITQSPWGDLVICEDTAGHCGLVGLTPEGAMYALADNAYTDSELAGVCFSPDGSELFVNIQERGLTLAVTGPWSTV